MIEITYTTIGPRISFRGQDLGYLWDDTPAVWPRLSRQDLIDLALGQSWLPKNKLHQIFFWANQKEMPERYQRPGTVLGVVGKQPYLLGRPTTPKEVKGNWDLATHNVNLGHRMGLEVWCIRPEIGLKWMEYPSLRPYHLIHDMVIDLEGKVLYAPGDTSPSDPDWLAATPYQDLEALKIDRLLSWKINPAAPNGKVKKSWLRGKERWGYVQSGKETWLIGPGLVKRVNPARKTVLKKLLEEGILRLEDPTAYLWFQATTGSKIHKVSVWTYSRGYQIGEVTVLGELWPGEPNGNWRCFNSRGKPFPVKELRPEQVTTLFEQIGPEGLKDISPGYFLGSEAGASWFVQRVYPSWQLITAADNGSILKSDTLKDVLSLVERHGLSQLLAMHQLARI
jgi:hypothetical protein